jgi:hypothetical protein
LTARRGRFSVAVKVRKKLAAHSPNACYTLLDKRDTSTEPQEDYAAKEDSSRKFATPFSSDFCVHHAAKIWRRAGGSSYR